MNPLQNQNQSKNTGFKRDPREKYYTKDCIANACLEDVRQNINICENDVIIEPSAGDGVFIPGMKSISRHCLFYDIEPAHAEIVEMDYLEWNQNECKQGYDKIHVIGNPPFGRQSSTAMKFIKKSCKFADSVSFILPKSFKKQSFQRCFPREFHLIFEKDLPEKSFFFGGVEYDVPCVFQIWEKRTHPRDVAEKMEPRHFRFVDKTDGSADISVRRVGVNAGDIHTSIQEKSIQSHYFIQFTNGKSIEENTAKLAKITYEFNNTVGPKSISKQELIAKFNPCLE